VKKFFPSLLKIYSRREIGFSLKCNSILERYEGKTVDFVFYFSAPGNSEHQVLMWLPYFEAVSENFVILVREKKYAKLFTELGYPTYYARKISQLDVLNILMPRIIFYVNNGMRNLHCVRYGRFIHAQLLHGESDKPPSFNPVVNLYDKVLVAGDIAIKRYYDREIYVPMHKFKIISRPQCEKLDVSRDPILLGPKSTIFYATTWRGFYSDADLSSLDVAYSVCELLVEMGFRVIFRPHPYSYDNSVDLEIIESISELLCSERNKTGLKHCLSTHSKFNKEYSCMDECINASDLMISDVTSVLGDWLYTNKPYITLGHISDVEKFLKENYLARAGVSVSMSQIEKIEEYLNELITFDSFYDLRVQIRKDALGLDLDDNVISFFESSIKELFEFDKRIDSLKRIKQDLNRISA
jgi:hypothetical protein